MKVLFLTAEPPWPLDQGDKLRNYHLLKALALKHKVTLVCFCAPEEGDLWRSSLEPFCEAIHTVLLSRKRMIINSFLHPGLPVTMAARISSQMLGLIKRLTSGEEYDLIFTCQLKMGAHFIKCQGKKKVIDLTDLVSLLNQRMIDYIRFWPSRLFRQLEVKRLSIWENKIATIADLVLFVSAIDASFMRKANCFSPIEVLSNGVDLQYFQTLPDSSKPIILFYGHLRYLPNSDGITWFVHEIFPKVRDLVPEAELLVIGKDATRGIKAMATLPGIKLIGHVTDLRPYLANAAVMVAPLRFGTGVRNKILEAFSSQKAVVSTSLGCEGLSVVPEVHLEVADDPLIFAEKTAHLLKNSAARCLLAANGRKLVEEKYNWESIEKKLDALLP